MLRFMACACIVGLSLVAAARGQEKQADNSEYASWAQYKPGTSATYKSLIDAAGMKIETKVTMRLAKVGAEKLVLEMETALTIMGNEVKQPPMRRDVPKLVSAEIGKQQKDPPGKVGEGTGKVTVAGKEYDAKWIKTETKADQTNVNITIWTSDKVPGQLLKMESISEGAGASKNSMELVELIVK